MTRKFTDALLNNATLLVESGTTLKDTAIVCGVNPDVLSKHLRARGVKIIKRGSDCSIETTKN
ncbi:MAG: hypothetical protein LUQ28_14165, partial [Methylococcaceae bacterium]|nr:hypothetical protein [Methylococcaceae bacterium]